MENGLSSDDSRSLKMGASNNSNTERIPVLQERKEHLEETLAKRKQELRQLCIQEAELTGVMPTELPLEPGESPPLFRRRVGTTFQLPQNLINNLSNEDESVSSLELNMKVQANMAEAALSLANEANISKTIRRQHMAQYQYHKRQYNSLEEKLSFVKTRSQMVQQMQPQKQKKKPRPSDQDDVISVAASVPQIHTDPFGKSTLRHSLRSLQYTKTDSMHHLQGNEVLSGRNSEDPVVSDSRMQRECIKCEDPLLSGIYGLSLNGYKAYIERKESGAILTAPHMPPPFLSSHSNPNLHHHSPHYNQTSSYTLPHMPKVGSQHVPHGYPKYLYLQPAQHGFQSTVTSKYYPAHTIHGQSSLRHYQNVEHMFRNKNPHQLQPHQQYEHDVMNAGLGGYWKASETGELVWCNTPDKWEQDKRFGSLDRRRKKRLQKQASPLLDNKSATISTINPYPDSTRHVAPKQQQPVTRCHSDNTPLVRTQSLGSVGVHTVDGIWPSDDNSSCSSDVVSTVDLGGIVRKHKQKEWYETSLDGPTANPQSPLSPVGSYMAPMISPEDKYLPASPLPELKTIALEIPAESCPVLSPTVPEPNMELFNNNILKHGTLIQAGHCKPYHEETKPFEMSDFYKYSTKFNRSPSKQRNLVSGPASPSHVGCANGDNHTLPPAKPTVLNNNIDKSTEPIGSPGFTNVSLNANDLPTNVADSFSNEMNAWYQSHEHTVNNNGSKRPQSSTATLV